MFIDTANIFKINQIKIVKYHSQSLTLTFKILYYNSFFWGTVGAENFP